LLRRRWWLILPTFIIWGAVWAISWFVPASYKSETLILVEQQKVPAQYVVPNVTSDLQDRLQSMTEQILSRTRLMRIIDQFQLYADLKSHLTLDEMVDKMRKDIKIDLVQAPGPPGRMAELTAFKIKYSSTDPQLAQKVTGQLTSLFIDENLKERAQQSESTTDFLGAQLEQARKTLTEQEQHVREFKSKNLGALPDQLGSNLNILGGLQSRLQQEMQAVNQSRQQASYLETLLDQYRAIRVGVNEGSTDLEVPPALDGELMKLKTQLADIRSRYTERFPDYRRVKEQIAQIESMKKNMAEDLKAAAAKTKKNQDSESSDHLKGGVESHPTTLAELKEMSPMVQLEGQVKQNHMELENRQKLVTQLEAQIQQYQARLNETPIKEQQLADLTRDYDQSLANYNSLLSKRNQSELATSLEKRQQGEQFRIIDPPSLPLKPYQPDRILFALGGLLAGIFVSVTATAAVELLDGRVFHESDFKDLVNAPVLAEIPPLPTALENVSRVRRLRLEWAGALVMLLIMAGGFAVTVLRG
jgi:polysaccharide chain length determinant protein (PEP-CTERM system associated)